MRPFPKKKHSRKPRHPKGKRSEIPFVINISKQGEKKLVEIAGFYLVSRLIMDLCQPWPAKKPEADKPKAKGQRPKAGPHG